MVKTGFVVRSDELITIMEIIDYKKKSDFLENDLPKFEVMYLLWLDSFGINILYYEIKLLAFSFLLRIFPSSSSPSSGIYSDESPCPILLSKFYLNFILIQFTVGF